ncbi:DUF6228 family protein [Streptomyces sp. NPDC059278]|uniref:DUF6228 family protein n=1 Tax=Streptomyces sp. NPDC059278 TaxID=3346801 RepID=UPI0036B46A64
MDGYVHLPWGIHDRPPSEAWHFETTTVHAVGEGMRNLAAEIHTFLMSTINYWLNHHHARWPLLVARRPYIRRAESQQHAVLLPSRTGKPRDRSRGYCTVGTDLGIRPAVAPWPTGSARGGWRAGACAAPPRRATRPSSPR